MRRTAPITVLSVLLVLAATVHGTYAQSIDLEGNSHALNVRGSSDWTTDGFGRADLGFGVGIAGRLDIGFGVATIHNEIEETDAQETRLTFLMRGLVARQSEGFPVSIALAFSYYFSQVRSDYLDTAIEGFQLLRSGRGYTVGGEIIRDFHLSPRFALRSGIGGGFVTDRSTTTVASAFDPDVDTTPPELTRYPVEEIETELRYSATFGPVFRSEDRRTVTSILAVFRGDEDVDLSGALELGVTFAR